jgi:hypothetical protein
LKRIIALLTFLTAFFLTGYGENIRLMDRYDSICCSIINEEIFSNTADKPSAGTCAKLYGYISSKSNGASVMKRVKKLRRGSYHNACAYTVSEALRRIGVRIPSYVNQTRQLDRELAARGFKRSYDIGSTKPGAIAFTTPSKNHKGSPTHVYIFMGWSSPGVAWIFDNQVYDYGSFYHNRPMKFYYFKGNMKKPKEATSYFMYK